MNGNPTIKRADWRPMHAFAIIGFTAVAASIPAFRIWPLLWVAPLLAYTILVAVVPPLRTSFRPWRFGRISTPNVVATGIIAVGSCAVLVGFHLLTRPVMSAYRGFLPVSSLGGVIAAGVLFSVFNAFFEEVIFRGILFDAVESQWGVWVAVVATAFLFGYGHLHGYPPGPLGAVLAGIYGLCLGWLRVFSGGMGLPVIAHIAADATIFSIAVCSSVL